MNPETPRVSRTRRSVAGSDVRSIWPDSGSAIAFSSRTSRLSSTIANNPIPRFNPAINNVLRVFPSSGMKTRAAASVPNAAPKVFRAYSNPTFR